MSSDQPKVSLILTGLATGQLTIVFRTIYIIRAMQYQFSQRLNITIG